MTYTACSIVGNDWLSMRKAERLFYILNQLRHRRMAITARQLASALNVSERTIYRDVQSLILSGVPIEGEAGVGYCLRRQYDLPPLMFSASEVEALLLGARMVKSWSDRQLASSASQAMQKILAVLPAHLRELEDQLPIKVPQFQDQLTASSYSEVIRKAIKQKRALAMGYSDVDDRRTQRTVYPLGLFFWGNSWTLVAWCLLRKDYRVFRLDRILECEELDIFFVTDSTMSLENYLQSQRAC